MNEHKLCMVATLLMLITLTTFSNQIWASTVFLNISTDKQVYYTGDKVNITGNVTLDGVPVSDALVGIQVNSPFQTPYLIRTAPTGEIQSGNWEVNITEFYTCDAHGIPQTSFLKGSLAYYKIKWKNYANIYKQILIGIYVEYSNKAPCKAYFPFDELMPPQAEETLILSFEIPYEAPLGTTTLYASIFTQTPKEGGYPYCPEKATTFNIISYEDCSDPPPTPATPLQNFNINFSLAFAKSGTYYIYAGTSYAGSQASNSMTFGVQPKALPPIAEFQWYPCPAGVNLSITFDASDSIAQGYNDIITQYRWVFGDGTPPVTTTSPKVTHTFKSVTSYLVTLNVTDNEGLWSTKSKIVDVLAALPPKACFKWTPTIPATFQTITFDASNSKPGWNGSAYVPIINYFWDFGDGHVKSTTNSITTYSYTLPGNYTVTLIVTDADGRQNFISKIVLVYASPTQGSGDLDGNGRVDMTDIIIVVTAFGSTPEKPNWDPRADTDGNGRVDMTDVVTVVSNFGKVYQ
ncbi:MAG: PKD domain-containing protein [Candidatus Bathyarchaeia archaeon]